MEVRQSNCSRFIIFLIYGKARWTNTHKLVSLYLREKAKVYTLRYTNHINEQARYNMLDIAIEFPPPPANGEEKIMSVLKNMMIIQKR